MRIRTLLSCAAAALLLVASPAHSQSTPAGRWDWATTSATPIRGQGVYSPVFDAVRQRLYTLTYSDTVTRQGTTVVPPGTALTWLDARTGQWLGATPLLGQRAYSYPTQLVLEPTTGDLILTGQYYNQLTLGPFTLQSPCTATACEERGYVARFAPTTGTWRWVTETGGTNATISMVTMLPGGDVAVAGAFWGDSVQLGTFTVRNPVTFLREFEAAGFVARLDGATGQWQWGQHAGGRPRYSGIFPSYTSLQNLVYNAGTGMLLLAGATDSVAHFGSYSMPDDGTFVAQLDPADGHWVGLTTMDRAWNRPVYGLTTDGLGNAYLAGESWNDTTGEVNLYVARLGAGGQWDWTTLLPNPYQGNMAWEAGGSVAADAWGNVFVAGRRLYMPGCGIGPGAPAPRTSVYRFDDATGALTWTLRPTNSTSDDGVALVSDGFGSAYLVGTYSGAPRFGTTTLPAVRQYYYRLFAAKLTDQITSRALSTAAATTTAALALWPNPARETLHLTLPAPAPVQLLDPLGRVVRTAAATTTEPTLDLRGLPAGLYTVRSGAAARQVVVE